MAIQKQLAKQTTLPKPTDAMTKDVFTEKVTGYINTKWGARLESCTRRQKATNKDHYPRFNLDLRPIEVRPTISELKYMGAQIVVLDSFERVMQRKFYLSHPERIDIVVEEAVSFLENCVKEFVAMKQKEKEREGRVENLMQSLGHGLQPSYKGSSQYEGQINGMRISAHCWLDEKKESYGLDIRSLKYTELKQLLAFIKKLR